MASAADNKRTRQKTNGSCNTFFKAFYGIREDIIETFNKIIKFTPFG